MSDQTDLFLDVAAQAQRRQFRMRRLQVYNWGTFQDLHDIAIAEQGFLFVGRSGSGKSTLLDAIASLLTPPQWLSFNAAAREGERSRRDRNLVSYVRGAWGDRTDTASGEIATHYLRRGTTWSALALSFVNGEGRWVTLIHLYWLRGSGAATSDIRRHYMIAERDFDIARALDGFDLDIRGLKRRLHDIDHFGDTFRPYGERFRRLLNIDSEQALKLLHKTQSAKNLGDLNSFLREFMLERPDTFEAAERLVAEFAELDAAHQEVVTARRQVDTLQPAREQYEKLQRLDSDIAANERLLEGIDAYTEGLRITLLETAIGVREARILGLEGEIRQQEQYHEQAQTELRNLASQHREQGGERVEQLEDQRRSAERQREERLKNRGRVAAACRLLGWRAPDTPSVFGAQLTEARARAEAWGEWEESEEQKRDALRDRKKTLESEFAEVRREIAAMERQPSNIPAHMLALRCTIAEHLGCGESELPFVGELMQVREDESAWRGAIERLLHGFALSLLVDKARYSALSEYVDHTHLGGRLVYYRVHDELSAGALQPPPQSLLHKLQVKETVFRPWLEGQLMRRFNYACVENLRDLRSTERALTQAGQVRHGRDRHEKDDRWRIDDRSRWVLGFDNREKLAFYRARAGELGGAIATIEGELNDLREARDQERKRLEACYQIVNLDWQAIDVASVLDRIASIERQLKELRQGNRALRELGEHLDRQREIVGQAEQILSEKRAGLIVARQERDRYLRERESAKESLATCIQPDEASRAALESRFHVPAKPSLSGLEERRRKVERAIHSDQQALHDQRAACIRRIEQAFAEFKREWPQSGADMDATLEAAPDFLALLQRLERDGLPRHEKRFFDMLREQSSENLAALNTYLSQARKDIHARMELVNEGLAEAEFNPGTCLQIEVHDRHLPDVREFNRQVAEVLRHAWRAEREVAERRFLMLKALVKRLSGEASEDRRWRELVLDVRLHVEFIGREIDRQGAEVEIYRSGAGKSGGQREKLATTCLAAALRYQLGGSEGALPTYASVVLDEAFAKADNEFTELAMRIFEKFGFQMIVATPLKAVMTLEPFIGGACFVDISDRKRSATLPIEYDQAAQRLDLPRPVHGEELTA